MPDAHQDMRHILAAAGLDLAAIRAAMGETRTREERAVALVRAFGALRQRDLAQLMDMSSATVSRLVSVLLAAGSVREHAFKDGAVGRPTDWLLALEGDPPSYQQRQVIIASLPDIIANLNTTLSPAIPLSLPVYAAVEEPPISAADPPAHSAPNVPPVSHEEPSAQMPLALWFGTVGEAPGAPAETRMARSVADEMPPIRSADERFVPLPPTATYVAPSMRSRSQSPIPPWGDRGIVFAHVGGVTRLFGTGLLVWHI